MGLRLLLETADIFSRITEMFLMGDLINLKTIRTELFKRHQSFGAQGVWNNDFDDAFDLTQDAQRLFKICGSRKIEEAHFLHPRHDCTTLEEIGCAVSIESFSSTTQEGDPYDLPYP
ncbi:hypothetical protein LCGC14_0318840 [marine sediment metagenome]|uniref:Uncharacterized protein n=1 Tax=marine sediment metagenome TaxID=412755 RepID=A0A0F9WS44_9ZZZZ